MRKGGFEPPLPKEHGPKPCAATCYATRAIQTYNMKCPSCGSKDVYIGLTNVECSNKKCTFFKEQPTGFVLQPDPSEEDTLEILLTDLMDLD